MQYTRRYWRLLGNLAALLSILVAAVGLHAPAAWASNPPNNWSFYVASWDTNSTAQQLGCNQANYDKSVNANSFVTLDFGAQYYTGSGTYVPSTTIYWSNSTIEAYAENFAYGYQICGSSHYLTFNVGTNNDGSVTDGALGADWGSLVQSVASNVSNSGYANVIVYGAIDAEAGYGPFAHLYGWEFGDSSGPGFASRFGGLISDFGSADGCPQSYYQDTNRVCSGDWYLSSDYEAAWGWSPNIANPEIYYDGCYGLANEPVQWANISDFGAHYGFGAIFFEGPLSQNYCLSPAQSYNDLVYSLNVDGAGVGPMPFLTQIVTK